MKCKNCKHNKRAHVVDIKGRILRGNYKNEYNGAGDRYEPFACISVGCNCKGYNK